MIGHPGYSVDEFQRMIVYNNNKNSTWIIIKLGSKHLQKLVSWQHLIFTGKKL
jgi:hypothetical protein